MPDAAFPLSLPLQLGWFAGPARSLAHWRGAKQQSAFWREGRECSALVEQLLALKIFSIFPHGPFQLLFPSRVANAMVVWQVAMRTILPCDILFCRQGVQFGFALSMASERPEFRLVTSAQAGSWSQHSRLS